MKCLALVDGIHIMFIFSVNCSFVPTQFHSKRSFHPDYPQSPRSPKYLLKVCVQEFYSPCVVGIYINQIVSFFNGNILRINFDVSNIECVRLYVQSNLRKKKLTYISRQKQSTKKYLFREQNINRKTEIMPLRHIAVYVLRIIRDTVVADVILRGIRAIWSWSNIQETNRYVDLKKVHVYQ